MIGVEIKTTTADVKKPDLKVLDKALEVLKSAGFSDEVLKEVKDMLIEECNETPEEEKAEDDEEKAESPDEEKAEGTDDTETDPMMMAFKKFKDFVQAKK